MFPQLPAQFRAGSHSFLQRWRVLPCADRQTEPVSDRTSQAGPVLWEAGQRRRMAADTSSLASLPPHLTGLAG